jgi:hypothetical protein
MGEVPSRRRLRNEGQGCVALLTSLEMPRVNRVIELGQGIFGVPLNELGSGSSRVVSSKSGH